MRVKKIWTAYFSPTGGTKNIVRLLAGKIAEELKLPVGEIDFTLPESRESVHTFSEEDLLILGTPVYAGRIPNKILPDVDRIFEGQGTPAIAVSVFGNRNFDEALKELSLLLERHGFHVLAAAATANRHAFSDKIGAGRPDEEDKKQLAYFAKCTAGKLTALEEGDGEPAGYEDELISPLAKMPGSNPPGPYYTPMGDDGEPARFLKAKPVTDTEKCIGCMACVPVCPMGSVDKEDVTKTNGVCIKCQACIHICPVHARTIEDERFRSHVRMLEKNYVRRAANRFFL